jgi:hypothetical protein
MTTEAKPSGLQLLRAPFPANQISKLPKPTKAQTDAVRADFKKGIRCAICGAWHHPDVIHLDYVGHAALTDRLLDADPMWTWEPMSVSAEGLPVLDPFGGMWIKLTVCGVTRLGYGHAGDKTGGDAIKETIGDALRNAAMRFGAALDLWHKGDLHAHDGDDGPKAEEQKRKENGRLEGVGVHKPSAGMFEKLDEDQQRYILLLASVLPKMFEQQGVEAVCNRLERDKLENDMFVALWDQLGAHSKLRNAVKAEQEKRRLAQKETA